MSILHPEIASFPEHVGYVSIFLKDNRIPTTKLVCIDLNKTLFCKTSNEHFEIEHREKKLLSF